MSGTHSHGCNFKDLLAADKQAIVYHHCQLWLQDIPHLLVPGSSAVPIPPTSIVQRVEHHIQRAFQLDFQPTTGD